MATAPGFHAVLTAGVIALCGYLQAATPVVIVKNERALRPFNIHQPLAQQPWSWIQITIVNSDTEAAQLISATINEPKQQHGGHSATDISGQRAEHFQTSYDQTTRTAYAVWQLRKMQLPEMHESTIDTIAALTAKLLVQVPGYPLSGDFTIHSQSQFQDLDAVGMTPVFFHPVTSATGDQAMELTLGRGDRVPRFILELIQNDETCSYYLQPAIAHRRKTRPGATSRKTPQQTSTALAQQLARNFKALTLGAGSHDTSARQASCQKPVLLKHPPYRHIRRDQGFPKDEKARLEPAVLADVGLLWRDDVRNWTTGYVFNADTSEERDQQVVLKINPANEDEHIVVKAVPVKYSRAFQRGLREALALHRLKHPNIVQILGYYLTAAGSRQQFCQLLEYIESGDLIDLIDHQKLALTDPHHRQIIAAVAKAVAYLHEHSFAHRDIKPDNVLVRYSTNPLHISIIKLADFGFVTLDDPDHPVHSCPGSARYVAPELLDLHWLAYNVQATDIWSLGATLWTLVNNDVPYSDYDNADENQLIKARCCYPESLPELGSPEDRHRLQKREIEESAIDLISRCCQQKPESRIKSKQILLHPWLAGGAKK